MRFSLGVYTREQTLRFLEKVLTWEREGLPSQFAVEIKSEGTLLGYCGFFHQDVDGKSEIEIGYRLHPDYWNKGLATESGHCTPRSCFSGFELTARHLVDSSGEHRLPARRRENRDDTGEAHYFPRLSSECVFSVSPAMAEGACRLMNSRARAR